MTTHVNIEPIEWGGMADTDRDALRFYRREFAATVEIERDPEPPTFPEDHVPPLPKFPTLDEEQREEWNRIHREAADYFEKHGVSE